MYGIKCIQLFFFQSESEKTGHVTTKDGILTLNARQIARQLEKAPITLQFSFRYFNTALIFLSNLPF